MFEDKFTGHKLFVNSNFPQNSLGGLVKLKALDLVKVSLKVF